MTIPLYLAQYLTWVAELAAVVAGLGYMIRVNPGAWGHDPCGASLSLSSDLGYLARSAVTVRAWLRYPWICRTVVAPSPTAAATRLTEP
jgi:hypothetical protein